MDAVKFLVTRDRMCGSFNGRCTGCEVKKRMGAGDVCIHYMEQHPQEVIEIVERWGKDHPRKTRQSEFLKMFPDARLFDGVLAIDPCKINSLKFDSKECRSHIDEFGCLSCDKCREQFWLEEVEDEDDEH